MYVGQLTLSQQMSSDKDRACHAIYGLLSAYRTNGQICGTEWPIAITSGGYEATVLLPEETSLHVKHHNGPVRKALQELGEAGLAETGFRAAKYLEGMDVCKCERQTVLVLYTNFLSLEPPLRCGSCFHPIPLYHISPPRNEEYQGMIAWQSSYQSCDTLQMRSGPLNLASMRQLSRLESRLSQDGLEICRQVYEATQIPTYYYLYRYGARSTRQEQKRLCPSCEREWLLPTPWHIFDFKCDHCHLISNIAWDVR